MVDIMKYRSPARNRYLFRLFMLMASYLTLLLVAVTSIRGAGVTGVGAWALAIAPALPVIGIFWAVIRLLIEEPDEFIKLLHVRQCLVATGFCLSALTILEFLQSFQLITPGTHGFGAVIWWFIGLGVGAAYNRFTLGASAD
jgi:hypothetical protein